MKIIDETGNYFLEEIKQNELMSRKHKKVCITIKYTEHISILQLLDVFHFAFTSLLGISIGIMGSTIELKFFAVAAGIKKCKSIIKKQGKKHDKIVLLAKSKFNSTILIFKALIDWNISHDEFILANNVLNKLDDMKEEIKNLKTLTVCQRF